MKILHMSGYDIFDLQAQDSSQSKDRARNTKSVSTVCSPHTQLKSVHISIMSNSFLLKDVTIFTGDSFVEDGYVAVTNGKISYVGAEAPNPSLLPPNLKAISMPRRTIIPGLIDAHVHGLEGNIECLEQSLRFGVTTVCDMHNDSHSLGVLTKVYSSIYLCPWSI